ncbi:MAG: hypothetical protein GWP61_00560 [Chloroflexi bacterium]|nr:hypothetical protein [Chloroflexota bacterium]
MSARFGSEFIMLDNQRVSSRLSESTVLNIIVIGTDSKPPIGPNTHPERKTANVERVSPSPMKRGLWPTPQRTE